MKNFEKTIRAKGKCCITEKPLKDSKHINMVQMHIRAGWEFPVWGNFITGEQNMAVAYLHDDAILPNGQLAGKIKFLVEFRGEEIIYHDVRRCRVCGCTEEDCLQCIENTGKPCHWVETDLCSACMIPVNK